MYNCIVFDVDGTLIDTDKAIMTGLKEVFKSELNINLTKSELESSIGVTSKNVLKAFNIEDSEELEDKWHRAVIANNHLVQTYDGIKSLLEGLKQMGITLGVVTSRKGTECFNDPLFKDLSKYFDIIVHADCTERHKPSPEPMEFFLAQSNLTPDSVLFIGDTIYDSQCAQGSNVDFLLAGWGANDKNIPSMEVLTHPYEILKYVRQ